MKQIYDMPKAVLISALLGMLKEYAPVIEKDNETNLTEGWAVFNIGGAELTAQTALSVGIEKLDEMDRFIDDNYLCLQLASRALKGDVRAARALAVQSMADRLRILTWGPEWVDSRMGPPA